MRTKIKEYRAKHNLTQAKLAQIVGVRRETIVFLEQGKYNPSLRLAHDVAQALGARIEDIFIFDDGQPDTENGEGWSCRPAGCRRLPESSTCSMRQCY
ncbi:MAG: helix-turn-helix transcriptional regulator [Thermoleophilia bacterium]|nr:helix-turn-helix transcriptional regulator [Thermoleophilia bacterium]